MAERPGYYAVIPSEVRYDKSLCPNARLLFGELSALANAHGYCFATNAYFATLYGVSQDTVSGWIAQLFDAKHIYVALSRQGRRIYIKTGVGEKSGGGRRKERGGVGEKSDHNTTLNTTSKKSGSPQAAVFEAWFAQYPRRTNKKLAMKAWEARRKDGVSVVELTTARDNYAKHLAREKTELRYVLHPSTFLGPNERWRDYAKVPQAGIATVKPLFTSRVCPKCGYENHHTGSMCLKCREEL